MDESRPTLTSAQWLLPDVLATVFYMLDVRCKGRAAQVCRAWRDVVYIPRVWRDVQVSRLSPASLVDIYVQRGIRRIKSLTTPTDTWLQDLEYFLAHCERMVFVESIDLSDNISLTNGRAAGLLKMTMKSLRTLNLGYCSQLRINFVEVIADECPNLARLQLEACFQSDQPLDGNYVWKYLSKLSRLKHLDLTACPVDDEFFECLAETVRRGEVVTPVTGGDAPCVEVIFGQLPPLTCLNLNWCDALTDVSLRYLSQSLPHLKSLSVAHCNRITCDGMKYLSEMKCLRRLILPCLRRRRLNGVVGHGGDDNDHGVKLLSASGILNRLDSLSVVGISDRAMALIAPCTRTRSDVDKVFSVSKFQKWRVVLWNQSVSRCFVLRLKLPRVFILLEILKIKQMICHSRMRQQECDLFCRFYWWRCNNLYTRNSRWIWWMGNYNK